MGWLPPLLPLPDDLEAIRQRVNSLTDDERHAQYAVEADRQRKGRR